MMLLFSPVSITMLIDTEDACFVLNGISPIAKGDLKWRDALLVTGTVNSNMRVKRVNRSGSLFLHLPSIYDILYNNDFRYKEAGYDAVK